MVFASAIAASNRAIVAGPISTPSRSPMRGSSMASTSCAVPGAERIVDILVGQQRQRRREVGIVLFFLRVESKIFQQRDPAGSTRLLDGFVGWLADAIRAEHHWALEEIRKKIGHRAQGELR